MYIYVRIYSGDTVDTLRNLDETEGGTQQKQPIMIKNAANHHLPRFNINL